MNVTDSLDDLQRRFAAALNSPDTPPGGLGIYHFHRRANFAQALSLAFPVVERLVGEVFFRRLAALHQDHQPSRSGDLQAASAGFVNTLRRYWPSGDYAWLADVAALEWAWQCAFVAADAPSLEAGALVTRPPSNWPTLRLHLHPSLTLIESPWPIVSIWDSQRDRTIAPPEIRLDRGGEWARIARERGVVTVRTQTRAQWTWLQALAQGASLAEADAAVEDDGETSFDLAPALAELFQSGLVSAFGDA